MPTSPEATTATLDIVVKVGSVRTSGRDLGQGPHLSSQGIRYPRLSTYCAAEKAWPCLHPLLHKIFENRGHARLDLGGISSSAHYIQCNLGRNGEEKLILRSGLGLAPQDDQIIEAERAISGTGPYRNQGGGLWVQTTCVQCGWREGKADHGWTDEHL